MSVPSSEPISEAFSEPEPRSRTVRALAYVARAFSGTKRRIRSGSAVVGVPAAACLLAGCVTAAAPAAVAAAPGWVIASVNLRAGPSTRYPAVTVIPAGSPITMYGCTAGYSWCDVQWGAARGWMAQRYLRIAYQSQRAYVPTYAPAVGVPIVTFSIGSYWDNYYTGYPWYANRWRYGWGGPGWGPGPGWGGPGWGPGWGRPGWGPGWGGGWGGGWRYGWGGGWGGGWGHRW